MVLPSYKSLRERSGGSSLTASNSETILRLVANSSSLTSASLNLASLTLTDGHPSTGSNLDTRSMSIISNCRGNNSMAGLNRGWGSVETRRASTSLSTMAGASEDLSSNGWARPMAPTKWSDEKDEWGYFVDTAEENDEDALMWYGAN